MAVIVVYGGGFQPFHAGHLSSYLQAKKAFPQATFYVAASNDTKTRPIPFNDKQFLAQQAGVVDPFVEVKMPINPKEILDKYNPEKDIFVLIRSERDPVGYTKKDGSPGYYQPYQNLESCAPFATHGYVFVTKKQIFKLNGQEVYSGTQVRDMYANGDDQEKINIIKQLYPKSKQQKMIKKLLDKYLSNTQPMNLPKSNAMNKLKQKQLKEQINKIRPFIKEGTVEQKKKFIELVQIALNESRIIDRTARINAYYVSDTGARHKVAENIPYYLLDKLVPLLTKKYAITMNDIEVRPVDHTQYRDTSRTEVADEGILGFGSKKPVVAKKPLNYDEIRQMARDSNTQQQVFRSKEEFAKSKQPAMAEDWNKVNHHDKTNGMSSKAVKAYRRENPGSKLKTAVTTKPSKLKAGSKDAKRRKSFCARMSGNKGPMKKPNGKPTPKALALRRWNCESVEQLEELVMIAEQKVAEARNQKQQAAIAISKKKEKNVAESDITENTDYLSEK